MKFTINRNKMTINRNEDDNNYSWSRQLINNNGNYLILIWSLYDFFLSDLKSKFEKKSDYKE